MLDEIELREALPRGSDLVCIARGFATAMHRKQRYGDVPYWHHLYEVVRLLTSYGYSRPEVLAAAWLHDCVEDTDATIEEIEALFGSEVAGLVGALTDEDGPRSEVKPRTMIRIRAQGSDAVRVKLADRIANVAECLDRADPRLTMYKNEHPVFRAGLYVPGEADDLWDLLQELLET